MEPFIAEIIIFSSYEPTREDYDHPGIYEVRYDDSETDTASADDGHDQWIPIQSIDQGFTDGDMLYSDSLTFG